MQKNSYPLKDILSTIDFPESTYYYWKDRFGRADPNKDVKDKIVEIRKKHKDYGYRRIHPELKKKGVNIGIEKVRKIIAEMGLQIKTYSKRSGRYNSYKGKVGHVAPNRINRRFMTSIPHQKITTDTTEFAYYEKDTSGNLQKKKLYLDPFLDMYNSEIISFKITKQPNGETIMAGLEEAIEKTKDCQYRRTFHSDQGWAYQMKAYAKKLKNNKIFHSMSRKGNCLDNSPMENFFSILKQEMYYGNMFYSYEALEKEITKHIHYYNFERSKEKLGYISPVEYRLKETKRAA